MSRPQHEPLLEMFIFETIQLLEQLEQVVICSEKTNSYSEHEINEIFRIMHTIKSSSAMMLFNNISSLSHKMEDLFYFIRENNPSYIDFAGLTDLILKGEDFIKVELSKIENGIESNDDSSELINEIKLFLDDLKKNNITSDTIGEKNIESNEKNKGYINFNTNDKDKKIFKAVIHFEEDCKMESVRAFGVLNDIEGISNEINHIPSNIIDDDTSDDVIKNDGFIIYFKTEYNIETVREILMQTVFLKKLELEEINDSDKLNVKKSKNIVLDDSEKAEKELEIERQSKVINQSMISVNIVKLDKLMDLVGELVISESMVTQNSDLQGLYLENFSKAARQLKKITGELQDTVMSIRMVPLSATFQKMNRIIRDMSKKLNKNVELEIIGEETEVDKNIIENISDPLMHIIRNAIDHGIEYPKERISKGKNEAGKIILEAKNAGSDVLVTIKDDGSGLNKEKILEKARRNGIINRPEGDLTDKEIFSFIYLPGFSTNDEVSEFSGRGVGMDVVTKNIEKIGGSVSVDSLPGKGTTITLKIPLTLAIIGGMNIKVGKSYYTVPITSIKESFKATQKDIIIDPDGNEMIMVRGHCFNIIRLHKNFNLHTDITEIPDGIIIMAEAQSKTVCILVDELIGEQQVVVKALPDYITDIRKVKGISGCTLLGNGSVSLIVDIDGLLDTKSRRK